AENAAGQIARSTLGHRVAAAGVRDRGQRRARPARRARRRPRARARRRRPGADGSGDPPRRPGVVRPGAAALRPRPPPRHRHGQWHRPDRRGLPGPADGEHLEPRQCGVHHRARRPHRAAACPADRARNVAGGGYFPGKRARCRRFRPHRRALIHEDSAMTAAKPRLKLSTAQLRPLLPLVAAVTLLAAAWLAWTGWQQARDADRAQALERSRDLAAQSTARMLSQQRQKLDERLASGDVQAALAAGDTATAEARLREDWPRLEQASILPADLDPAYAGLDQGGFGRLAVMEAALAEGGAAARVVKDDGLHLALAAPAQVGGQLVGVAYLLLPLDLVTVALQASDAAGEGYLALRQGSYTVIERGDPALAQTAEAMSVTVGDSGLRVAASLPDETAGVFGLGAQASFIGAGVLALLAVLAIVVARRKPATEEEAVEPEQPRTLQEALAQPAAVDAPAATAEAPVVPGAVAATAAGPAGDAAVATPVAGPTVDPGIFRASDVRGVVGKTLDIGVAELLGQAVGTLMHEQGASDILVGRDGRLSGPDMVAGLTEGLRKAGRNVIDIGMVPTPVLYFGTYELRTGCGIAVTGSHNPPDYNGFKIMVGGTTLSGDEITGLYERIRDGRLHTAEARGTLSQRDIADDYVARIATDVQLDRRIKVVVDAGNGVAGEIGPKVLKAIGADVVPLYCEIDGTFPNHHPDPSEPHNLQDLIEVVAREGAELGIAFDGDGDRLGVVTPSGANIFPDRLLMLFAADVLERNP